MSIDSSNKSIQTYLISQCHCSSCQVSQAMSKYYLKVPSSVTLKDAIKIMHDSQQNCVLVVDEDDFLEGILTYGDIRRCRSEKSNETSKSDSDPLDVCRKCPWSLYI